MDEGRLDTAGMDERGEHETESEEIREVYARFGLAMYYAQVVEHDIVNLMSASRLARRRAITRDEIEALEGRWFAQTLGRIIGELREDVDLPGWLDDDLRRALGERNRLAHRYFREHAADLAITAGRAYMLEDLHRARALFEDVDRALTDLLTPLLRAHGITEEMLRMETDRLLREASE